MPSKWAVVTRLKEDPVYVSSLSTAYSASTSTRFRRATLADPNEVPPAGVFAAYDAMARAIGEFEKLRRFNRFNSKFDFVMAGVTTFSEQEQRGFDLFIGEKAKCSACHVTDLTIAPDGSEFPPLLTDFTYDNIGLPRNQNIPGNPAPNPGLGGRADIAASDPAGNEIGKHKVMSLRNIAVTPPYMHNGSIATLEEAVHFYNTRDTKPAVCTDINDSGYGVDCWPEAEFPATINVDESAISVSRSAEETDIVAFMKTLTDNYPVWGNDPNVPRGTRSPFAHVPFPPIP